jgi:hypothetical protein
VRATKYLQSGGTLLTQQRRDLRTGVRPLHGNHCEIGPRRDSDAIGLRVRRDPRDVLVPRACVDDQAEGRFRQEVDDEVVDDAARLVQHAAVQRLAGNLELGDVVGEQIAQELARAAPRKIDDAHVRDIEHAGVAPHDVMLLDLGTVIDGHVPAAEVDHTGIGGDVGFVKRGAQTHRGRFLVSQAATRPGNWGVIPDFRTKKRQHASG